MRGREHEDALLTDPLYFIKITFDSPPARSATFLPFSEAFELRVFAVQGRGELLDGRLLYPACCEAFELRALAVQGRGRGELLEARLLYPACCEVFELPALAVQGRGRGELLENSPLYSIRSPITTPSGCR